MPAVTDKRPGRDDRRPADSDGRATRAAEPRLELESFLPYRLSILQLAVSRSLARIYATRFNLGRYEWRVLAVLAQEAPLTAVEIAERTSMDKVQVSRAVAKLIAGRRIARETDPTDRRRAPLRPTAKGLALYRQIVPLAKAHERKLIGALTKAEVRTLNRIIDKLRRRARDLQ